MSIDMISAEDNQPFTMTINITTLTNNPYEYWWLTIEYYQSFNTKNDKTNSQ